MPHSIEFLVTETLLPIIVFGKSLSSTVFDHFRVDEIRNRVKLTYSLFEIFGITFKANGNSKNDHVTMIIIRLPFTVFLLEVKLDSLELTKGQNYFHLFLSIF